MAQPSGSAHFDDKNPREKKVPKKKLAISISKRCVLEAVFHKSVETWDILSVNVR